MKTELGSSVPGENVIPAVGELRCAGCETSQYLAIESIQALDPKVEGWVIAEYSCGACGSFYAHDVSVCDLAGVLANTDAPSGVLKFGQQYVHCGEPMEEQGMELTGITESRQDREDVPSVMLPTIVLGCRCGFHMSIPR